MCINMCNPSKLDSMVLCNNILWWSIAPAGVLLSTHMMLDIVCNNQNPYISWYQCRVSKYAISLVLTEVWAHRYLFNLLKHWFRFPCLLLTKAWTFLDTQSNLWKSSSQPFLPSDSCISKTCIIVKADRSDNNYIIEKGPLIQHKCRRVLNGDRMMAGAQECLEDSMRYRCVTDMLPLRCRCVIDVLPLLPMCYHNLFDGWLCAFPPRLCPTELLDIAVQYLVPNPVFITYTFVHFWTPFYCCEVPDSCPQIAWSLPLLPIPSGVLSFRFICLSFPIKTYPSMGSYCLTKLGCCM
jgi:hypothetical protein